MAPLDQPLAASAQGWETGSAARPVPALKRAETAVPAAPVAAPAAEAVVEPAPAPPGRLMRVFAALTRFFQAPSRQVAAAAAACAAGFVVHLSLTQWDAYNEALDRSERDTRSAARLLAEHAARTFDGVEEVLRSVSRLRNDAARGIFRSQASIYVNLRTLRGGSGVLHEIGWFDQYGERIASSNRPDPPRANASETEMFRVLREAGKRELYVSPPQLEPAPSGWRMMAALRLENLDGTFAGVAAGTIDPEDFAKVYRTLDFGGLRAALIRSDGTVVATAGFGNTQYGSLPSISALFREHLPAAASGTYFGDDPLDNAPAVASYARVRGAGQNFVIHVSVTRAAALADFRRDLFASAVQAGFALVILLVGGSLLARSLRRRERLQGDLTAALARANAARDAAERANKAKSEFLANMSHELRTPLNAVIGFADMMIAEIRGPVGHASYGAYVRDIHKSGSHLLGIINDMLDVARIEAGKAELHEQDLSLADTIEDVAKIMAPQIGRGRLTLARDIDPAAPKVRADPRAMRQILLNLVSNAVKFTPESGLVTVALRRDPGQGVALAVSDTGIGISAAEIPRLMQPFAQVQSVFARKHQGAGLGLTLVRSFAELHGGAVNIESTPGRGTTVTVTLPESRVL